MNPPVPPVAASDWLYAVPTVPFGSDAVVTVSCGAAMEIVSDLVAVAPELSFTCAVNVAEPAAVGVPPIVPPADRVRPAGNDPDASDHVYPPVPPVAASV